MAGASVWVPWDIDRHDPGATKPKIEAAIRQKPDSDEPASPDAVNYVGFCAGHDDSAVSGRRNRTNHSEATELHCNLTIVPKTCDWCAVTCEFCDTPPVIDSPGNEDLAIWKNGHCYPVLGVTCGEVELDRADRAMRPLNFDLATSTDIYNHGDEWIQRMKRLKRLDYRPDQCLIAARAPKDETDHRGEAFRQIMPPPDLCRVHKLEAHIHVVFHTEPYSHAA